MKEPKWKCAACGTPHAKVSFTPQAIDRSTTPFRIMVPCSVCGRVERAVPDQEAPEE